MLNDRRGDHHASAPHHQLSKETHVHQRAHQDATPPARTHALAAALFRRPFAPGAIGFRAMSKVLYNGDPFGGAQVAAYLGAQSVLQRLNAVVPGRWRQEFRALDACWEPGGCTWPAG